MIAGDGPLPEERARALPLRGTRGSLASLDEREHTVLALRFGLHGTEPQTLDEIGRRLGFSRERARQVERNALRRLAQRREMEPLAATAT